MLKNLDLKQRHFPSSHDFGHGQPSSAVWSLMGEGLGSGRSLARVSAEGQFGGVTYRADFRGLPLRERLRLLLTSLAAHLTHFSVMYFSSPSRVSP